MQCGIWYRICVFRYFHAAVCVSAVHAMFVYGGISDMEGTMHEMWRYNIDSSRWSKLEVKYNFICCTAY